MLAEQPANAAGGICGGPYPVELSYSAVIVSPLGEPIAGVELQCGTQPPVRVTSDAKGRIAFSATVTGQHGCGHECSVLRLNWQRGERTETHLVSIRVTNGGTVVLEHPYEAGASRNELREGEWEGRYSEGQMRYRGQYRRGQKHGPWVEWWENGGKKHQGDYSNDIKQGQWQEFFPNGNLRNSIEYLEGAAHGQWQSWHLDGSLAGRGQLDHGRRIGDWVEYNRSGNRVCYWGSKAVACPEPDASADPR